MGIRKLITLSLLFIFAGTISLGCAVRTYKVTRDRLDQELSGNRGYLMGQPPAEGERKDTRTTRVFEFEFGGKKRAVQEKAPEAVSEIKVIEEEPEILMVDDAPLVEPVMDMQSYAVQKGDTLQKISMKFYGTTKKWMKIYNANTNVLKGPDKIYPGQTIMIPTEGMQGSAGKIK